MSVVVGWASRAVWVGGPPSFATPPFGHKLRGINWKRVFRPNVGMGCWLRAWFERVTVQINKLKVFIVDHVGTVIEGVVFVVVVGLLELVECSDLFIEVVVHDRGDVGRGSQCLAGMSLSFRPPNIDHKILRAGRDLGSVSGEGGT